LKPLAFALPYAVAFWAAFGWAATAEFHLDYGRRPEALGTAQDAGTCWWIVGTLVLLAPLAFLAVFLFPALAIHSARLVLFWVGVGLLGAGGLLRRHCFRLLGRSFTPRVRVVLGQEIVQRGAYRWVRHPAYAAGILMYTGLGLALGSWASVALLAGGTIAVYLHRIRVEERALRETLGAAYEDYMRRTARLVPFLF
jgi:protein-S-isoprenylcysteine O-methyltransferase Ste14